jgi:hypothetical protein
MSVFKDFEKKHGPASDCREAAPEVVTKYRNKLPEPIISEWTGAGWCAYGKGLLWFTNPEELKAAVKEWLGSKAPVVFARSAFGHLFLWDSEGAHMLDPQQGTIAKIVNNADVVFNYVLCRKQYLDDVLDQKLFNHARKKLGPLKYDECYGFEPAIALGGPGTLDTLRKVKLREHLSILSQLVDEVKEV